MTLPVWLLIALPLGGAMVLLLSGRRSNPWGHLVGTAASLASFACAAVLFVDMVGRPAEDRRITQTLFSWVPVGELQVDFGLHLDQLSMCFVLLITGVGSLIHIYSIGYMAEDPERRKFFGYLNLFLAAMLLLVGVPDARTLALFGWCSPTTTSVCTWAGREWAWRRIC